MTISFTRVQPVALLFLTTLGIAWPVEAATVSAWEPLSQIGVAAKKEGKLVIYVAPGHASPDAQRAMSKVFKEKFGVDIDWTSLAASDIAPRVLAEQRTQQYATDIAMSGIEGNYVALKPRGYVTPILAPSTLEKGVWRLDPATAFPKERDWLFISMPLRPSFFINTNLVRPGEEPKNYGDLLNPKWKGRIVLQYPWSGGTGSGWFRATYKKLGLDYMRALAKQVALTPTTGADILHDGVARGQYAMGLAASTTRGRVLIQEGAPVKFIQPEEGSHLSAQGLEFIANAPHSNAAKLFLHWFYTKEGQSVYAPPTMAISLRKDVSQDYLPPDERYVEGRPILIPDAEDFSAEKSKELSELAKQIFADGK